MCNSNFPKFPCRICVKNVSDKDKAVQCDLCELWVHIKCNNLINQSISQNKYISQPNKKCSNRLLQCYHESLSKCLW